MDNKTKKGEYRGKINHRQLDCRIGVNDAEKKKRNQRLTGRLQTFNTIA
jgi:hypothetical protein